MSVTYSWSDYLKKSCYAYHRDPRSSFLCPQIEQTGKRNLTSLTRTLEPTMLQRVPIYRALQRPHLIMGGRAQPLPRCWGPRGLSSVCKRDVHVHRHGHRSLGNSHFDISEDGQGRSAHVGSLPKVYKIQELLPGPFNTSAEDVIQ